MRFLRFGILGVSFAISGLVAQGCTGSTTSNGNGNDAGGGAFGAACSSSVPCRPGLACGSSATCELGHTTKVGSPCILNGQCVTGNVCDEITHTCAMGGTGDSGTGCKHDADCKDGLRCTLVGFTATCLAEGKGDLGSTCATAADCLGGLGCNAGKCIQGPPGAPPFGLSQWGGEKCATESTDALSYFRVPRGTADDGDFYRLPFPNDIRRSGGHPSLTGHPTPGSELLGVDVVQRYMSALEKLDGFGAYPTAIFRFSQTVDLGSLKDTVSFVDLTPGSDGYNGGYSWLLYDGASKYICANYLAIRPGQGQPFTPGHTYAALVTSGAKTMSGAAVGPDADFSAMLAPSAPGDGALATAYAAYAPLRAYLAAKPLSLINAAVFTVGSVTAPGKKLADTAAAAPPPTASGWVKCGTGPSPCPDATGDRACGGNDPSFDEWHALVTLPIYQQGKAPYLTPDDGGGIDFSGAVATKVRDEQVCMAVTVPHGTAPAAGFPAVIYAHGTGGSFRSAIGEGVATMLATAATPMVTIGIDQVQHGPRRGGSTESPNNLFYNFMNPAAALGNPLQGAADQLALGRFVATATLDAAPIDKASILFWGHSQGATEGAIAVPYTGDIKGAVLSGEGASLIDALLNKTSPVNIAAAIPFALQDPDPNKPTTLLGGAFHPVLSLLQQYIDPADPLNHGRAMAASPPMGLVGHHVFQPYGLGDTYSPPATEATYAASAALAQCAPDASASTPDKLGADPVASPVKGNFGSDKKLTAAVRQYGPSGYDGHFVAFKNDAAKADVVRFLSGMIAGGVPQVGPLSRSPTRSRASWRRTRTRRARSRESPRT